MKKISSFFLGQWAKIVSVVLFILLFSAYANIFAVFTPGQTLDPNCAPGIAGCIVDTASDPSQWTTSGSDIYFTGGNVGVGTNNPTSSLSLKGKINTIGADIVTNGTFDADATGWNLYDSASYNNGKLTVNYTGTENWADVSTGIITETGKNYVLTFTISDASNDTMYFWFDNNSFSEVLDSGHGNGTYNIIFSSDYSGSDVIYFENWGWNNNSSWSIDNVSIKEVSTVSSALEVLDLGGDKILSLGGNNSSNLLIGLNAGNGSSSVMNSNFIGAYSGYNASSAGSSNFIGYNAGYGATDSYSSNFLGESAGTGAIGAYDSNFLGYFSGNNATSAHHSNFIGPWAGDSAVYASYSNFLGSSAGDGALNASHSNFLGIRAGRNATNATRSNFLGYYSGYLATNASDSNFIGQSAGESAASANNSNFFGRVAGKGASSASFSNFIGDYSGYYATNSAYSNFIGYYSGNNATNASYSNFIGSSSGNGALNASNSIFIGQKAGLADTVNNTTDTDDWSILIGYNTKTGGFKNSILLGGATDMNPISNTKANQFMLAPSVTEMRLRNIDYTLPADQGGVGTVLTNDGNGGLTWAAGGGGGSSQWIDSGSDIYFATGNVGVGTTNPTSRMTIDGTVNPIGAELITNGSFTGSASGWTLMYDAAYFNNNVKVTAGTNWGGDVKTNISIESGKKYLLSFTLSNVSGDQVNVYFDQDSNTGYNFSNGENSFVFTANYTGVDTLFFENSNWNNPSSWTIDDVSLKEVSSISPSLTVSNFNGNNVLSLGNDINLIKIGNDSGLGVNNSLDSNFIGSFAGIYATDASNSNFFGLRAGQYASGSNDSNFFGYLAGDGATNSYDSNFLGYQAGLRAFSSSESNFMGTYSGSGASSTTYSNFIGNNSGQGATGVTDSNFFGRDAGRLAINSDYSNFIGKDTGKSASNVTWSNFIGASAGQDATGVSSSNFFGTSAGRNAINVSSSNFIGASSGYSASLASVSNFFGNNAGSQATNARNSNFFGVNAGSQATNAANSIFIGPNAGVNDTVNNTAAYNDISTFMNSSILVGYKTLTGGFSNSIAIGAYATNTASNQFMIGSVTRPIDTTRWNGSASTQCTLTTGTGIACTSDERLKTNITDLPGDTLDKLTKVKTVNFNWLEGDNTVNNIGFLAQDLEQYFPELVATDSLGFKSVYYASMTPILTEAIRELDLKVGELESLDIESSTSLGSLIKNFLGNIGNNIDLVFFGEVHTKKLCLDDLCITKEQLEQILNNNSVQSVAPGLLPVINDIAVPENELEAVPPVVDSADDTKEGDSAPIQDSSAIENPEVKEEEKPEVLVEEIKEEVQTEEIINQ